MRDPSDDAGDMRRVKASSSWVTGDLMNVSDVVDVEFLASLLTESTVSPLYGGLIKSGTRSRIINTGYFPKLRIPGTVITTFSKAMEDVATRRINRAMIGGAIIQVMVRFDQPMAPSERGMFDFCYNVSAAVQQARRTEILHMKAKGDRRGRRTVENDAKAICNHGCQPGVVHTVRLRGNQCI
jgi:Zn-dependent M16 (insulinase) family peptidase